MKQGIFILFVFYVKTFSPMMTFEMSKHVALNYVHLILCFLCSVDHASLYSLANKSN